MTVKTYSIKYVEDLLAEIERLTAELAIKSEWISTRQCPDHSGKWPRGNCLQCEIERLTADLHGHDGDDCPLCFIEDENERLRAAIKKYLSEGLLGDRESLRAALEQDNGR